jgi:two-component system alkaline phosphatase synthesis response regulator PhoP
VSKHAILAFRRIRVDAAARRAWVDEKLVDLTAIEFDMLRTLAEHRGMVLSREQLLEKIWETNYFGDLRVVDVHIGHLRQKLGEASSLIATVRGSGYRFDDERA